MTTRPMKNLTEAQAMTLKTLAAYEAEWHTKPTACEFAGYETAQGESSPDCRSVKAAAQALSVLHKRGLVLRWKTQFGFIYSVQALSLLK